MKARAHDLVLLLLTLAATPALAEPAASHKTVQHKSAARPDADADGNDPAEEAVHVVKPGETLGGIANRARVPRVLIVEANHLQPPYTLRAGQKLTLPRTRHHTVQDGETGFDIAYQYGVPFPAIAVANGLKPDAALKPGQQLLIPTVIGGKPGPAATPSPDASASPAAKPDDAEADSRPHFLWPVSGKVVRGYVERGNHNYHDGIDIAADEGTAVRATLGGEVVFADKEPQSFGQLVVIDHKNGWQSAYGFLEKITVKRGDTVKARERIGLVGHTGKAPRDELHFEIRKANQPTDPAESLPALAKKSDQKAEAKEQGPAKGKDKGKDKTEARKRKTREE